ncbi:MAG: sigma-54-dependent Fis family transcriptional regulator [Xanthomonadales bacterium]|nr:sigma-54-dependent Fis family transcriptional regulator [Xanthomonadales bacterium]ODU95279.1 MAG: sigma-54-dependent Fis family transcriptional regulator [Rhodanobacter sp. SCN 66-43]OJY83005.1 MAG: sigma-54-dependent Fis family transcriptional regulator [Xanthomonadales bacterium 66-474]
MTTNPDPTVLIVEDDRDLAEALCDILHGAGIAACIAGDGEAAWRRIGDGDIGLVLSDVQMPALDGYGLLQRIRRREPSLPVVMMTAHATIERAVRAMREGADEYLVKPFDAARLLEVTRKFVRAENTGDEPVAADPASLHLLEVARRVAASDATVLVCGESGTGKEVIARYLHRHSPRAAGPFVAINCAAIPESMLEATLFGHEKGAFTGAAHARAGTFERAQGGTLLLDEVSEMALPLQARLLRVLQEREVERIGGQRSVALDVRVVAATNRNLAETVRNGDFREDLFYRLNVFPLQLPALRERGGDILPLARHLVAAHARRMRRPPPRLSDAAQARLLAHAWPGNVRELDNLVQRALILCDGDCIDAGDLPLEILRDGIPAPAVTAPAQGLSGALRDNEDNLILDALRENRGSRRKTAAQLGVSERTLRYKLARLRDAGRLATAIA